ncbi:hypothetical protein AJ79_01759 [Helicocarpus griseus UAMH5409]|uniref:DUF7703 domain-containing protein n=1 Tax=Helicocarpus griseus UAMH5409 TaxID=1447875 RepID=A0A2B7Y6D2_9EURO|nr:hypothetical protein AJ79_01759 [Helicocarpus griseus UAMH5409]
MVLPTPEQKNAPPSAEKYGTTFPIVMTMSAFMTIALYNVIELHFLLFNTFKRKWHGLYFWSLLASVWGVAMNGLAVVFETFQFAENRTGLIVIMVFLVLGWYMMVTGQSLVLYSRLHLLAVNRRIIRALLIMIIVDALVLHIPNTIAIFLVNLLPPGNAAIQSFYLTYEPLQLTIFSVQELIISGVYIFRTLKVLKASQNFRGTPAHKTLLKLIYMNIFIIAMDVTLVALQFAGYDLLQHFYKPAVYSVKLKLEFAILNQLLEVMRGPTHTSHYSSSNNRTTLTGVPNGSKFMPGFNKDDDDPTYNAFAARNKSPNNNIPLSNIEHGGVTKTTQVTIRHEPSTSNGDLQATGNLSKPRTPSETSSQVPLAKSGT